MRGGPECVAVGSFLLADIASVTVSRAHSTGKLRVASRACCSLLAPAVHHSGVRSEVAKAIRVLFRWAGPWYAVLMSDTIAPGRFAYPDGSAPSVYLAFGFHINTSHSYRIDSADERGFAKDVVMIERILDALDAAEERGTKVCGVWDTEQMFAMEECMFRGDVPGAKDLLARLQHRVQSGRDEVIHMSYNNALAGAMTRSELDAAISRSKQNDRGSGLIDLFGCDSRIVRPQEMTFSSGSAEVYRSHGIDTICLYNSATAFGTFRPFIRPLSALEAHNPLRLEREGDPPMRVIPTYHTTDLIEHVSLRHWVRELHRRQKSGEIAEDVLLFVNFDADHESWGGFDLPAPLRLLPNSTGLSGLISEVEQLDYVRFTSLQSYLDQHEDCGTIAFEQDTADGAWNGYASWSEKYSSHVIFRAVRNDRRVERYIDGLKGLLPASARSECETLLWKAFDHRLRLLSTTCYGLATPFVAPGREAACNTIIGKLEACHDRLHDILREHGPSVPSEAYGDEGTAGHAIPGAGAGQGISTGDASEPEDFSLVEIDGWIAVMYRGQTLLAPTSFIPTITYNGQTFTGENVHFAREQSSDRTEIAGTLQLPAALSAGRFSYRFTGMTVEGEPLLLVDGTIEFPATPPDTRVHPGVEGLDRVWDSRWTEVEPFPLRLGQVEYEGDQLQEPGLKGGHYRPDVTSPPRENDREEGRGAVVSRENAFGRVGSYPVDYHTRNTRNWYIPSMNNHIAEPWCALSVNDMGIAVGIDERSVASFAPVPMRAVNPSDNRIQEHGTETNRLEGRNVGRVRAFDLNPYGSYYGPQWNAASWGRGVGIRVMEEAAEHLASSAPTFNAQTLHIRLVLAPFSGSLPTPSLQNAIRAACRPATRSSVQDATWPGLMNAESTKESVESKLRGPSSRARVQTLKEKSMPLSLPSVARLVRDSFLKPSLRFPANGSGGRRSPL